MKPKKLQNVPIPSHCTLQIWRIAQKFFSSPSMAFPKIEKICLINDDDLYKFSLDVDITF